MTRMHTIKAEYFRDQLPSDDDMEEGVLYISQKYQTAIHWCACGCHGKTVTPLRGIYAWTLDDGPTLRPSIGNQSWPCGSHYYITNGRIDWL